MKCSVRVSMPPNKTPQLTRRGSADLGAFRGGVVDGRGIRVSPRLTPPCSRRPAAAAGTDVGCLTRRLGGRAQIFDLAAQTDWSNLAEGEVRVMASIDDRGWRAFGPLTSDFIIRPDGTFVDE